MTLFGFLLFHKKASGADGVTPPGFLPPVKGQVACMKDLIGELHKLSFFGIMEKIYSFRMVDIGLNYKKYNHPYDHYIFENFFPKELAKKLSNNFLEYENGDWFFYNNPIENKKTISDWNKFPKETYETFQYLCSVEFISIIKHITGVENIYPDYGLHGGGWHIHGKGGNLNVHKDYSIHPKLSLQRKFNLIIYLSEDWDIQWGGGLELWSHNSQENKPLKLEKVVDCLYNRAILFDTTQNSWHGLPNYIQCPQQKFRKSMAVYYLTDLEDDIEKRPRALFAPRKEQESNQEILKIIEKRSKL